MHTFCTMRLQLTVLILFVSVFSFAQLGIEGQIKDATTKETIPYCAISIKNKAKGCLTNEEGIFKLINVMPTDTLLISNIGYRRKTIAVLECAKETIIYIERKENQLKEIVVNGNNDYIYQIIENCRRRLVKSEQYRSKAYFVLETEVKKQPVELLECYYNANFNNSAVRDLDFKNGRVGLATYNERYFINLNTSKVFTTLNLLGSSNYLPTVPFQVNKRQLKKTFQLRLVSVYDTLNPVYQIAFQPIDSSGSSFSGEMWIEKKTNMLKKITLTVFKTTYHPFRPIFKDFGEIQNVSMQITKNYNTNEGVGLLSHIDFNYQIYYTHKQYPGIVAQNNDTTFEVRSKGLLYFYDYNNLFILPKFKYNAEFSDYQKITSLTYNEGFWSNNNSLVYSDKMKKGLSYFKAHGQLINYRNNGGGRASFPNDGLFENNYLLWSKKLRLSLKQDRIRNDTVSQDTHGSESVWKGKFNLSAQLFLDINSISDSLQFFSASIFDVYETFYNIKEEPNTNCFLNIYFDLYEIERRKMEKIMSSKTYSPMQLDSIYRQSVKNLETQTFEYIKQVNHGTNSKALEKWNNYVLQQLEIDNFLQFGVKKSGL